MRTRAGTCKDGTPVYVDDMGLYSFGCFLVAALDAELPEDVTIEIRVETTPAPPAEKPKPDEKETEEEIRKRARKPPAGGKCVRCGEPKPINRLKLCYPCWVKFELEKDGWKEGQPHPKTCGCGIDCAFDNPTTGN